MHGFCEVNKDIIDNCLLFWPILSVINTPTYKVAKFLVLILTFLTSNEYTVKDSFAFAEEIVEQDSELFMWSLNWFSLLEETIEIFFKNTEIVESLSNIEFKERLSFATK